MRCTSGLLRDQGGGGRAWPPTTASTADDRGFPWEFRPGPSWSRPGPSGCRRPTRLRHPCPPEDDLPDPFKHLTYFTEKDAEVFFGRGYQIRVLYGADGNGPPILLLHDSGVGKSSLLDAGLVPR